PAHRRVHCRSPGARRHLRLPRCRRCSQWPARPQLLQLPVTAGEQVMSAYDQPHLFASLDSLEGVPDIFEPRHAPAEDTKSGRAIHNLLEWVGVVLPGIGLALGLAAAGYMLSEFIGAKMHYDVGKSPISPITLAVLLGLIIRN